MKLRMVAAALALTAFTLTGCSSVPEQNEANREEAAAVLETLQNADTIALKKSAVSFGDHWSVEIAGKEVAVIEGLDLPTVGDTYSILSPTGGFVAGEDEAILTVAKTAHFYDQDLKAVGTLTKELFSWGAKYHLKNAEGEELAKFSQKFGLTLKGDIEDGKGRLAWRLSSKAITMAASLTLTREATDTTVSTTDAILIAVVASEIYDAENSD